jgi:hypothetical protein
MEAHDLSMAGDEREWLEGGSEADWLEGRREVDRAGLGVLTEEERNWRDTAPERPRRADPPPPLSPLEKNFADTRPERPATPRPISGLDDF